jgi:hypothetical protein
VKKKNIHLIVKICQPSSVKDIDLPNTGLVIRSVKHGKYRWLAEVYPLSVLDEDNIEECVSFNQILIDEGFEKRAFYEPDKE